MKATIDVPDDLYRRVKAKSAMEAQTVREVTVSLYRAWLATPVQEAADQAGADDAAPPAWFGAARHYAERVREHDMDSIRESIARGRRDDGDASLKSAAIDTSLVVRLLTNSPEDLARRALDELRTRLALGAAVFVSDLVVAETYFALQHHYMVPKAEAIALLSQFLVESGVTATGAAPAVLAVPRLATTKPGFVDRLIHAEAIRVAEEFLTFETAARRLKHARVLRV